MPRHTFCHPVGKEREESMNTQGDKGPRAEAGHTGTADGLSQGTRF